METTKIKVNRFIAVIAVLLTILGISFFASVSASAYADTYFDAVVFSRHTPTLRDDFADDRVIVTLKSGHSDVNK